MGPVVPATDRKRQQCCGCFSEMDVDEFEFVNELLSIFICKSCWAGTRDTD